ncbi:MAG: glycosyltransferase family 9 protein [bacterium]
MKNLPVICNIERILIIKLRGIGDVILTTIVLDNLRKAFPNCQIDFLTDSPSVPLLKPLKQIDNVIEFNRKNIFKRLLLFPIIRNKKYDLVLDFFSNPASAQLTYFSKAKYRVGFPYKGRTYAYNYFGPSERDKFHSADLNLELLKSINLPNDSKTLYVGLEENHIKFADDFFYSNFNKNEFVVGIIPGGGWASKKCDPIKFAEITDEIISKYNVKVLILWGPGDKTEAEEIIHFMKHKSVLAPATTINQMAAIIQKCKFIIANDSGPMHISAALGTPTLAIHGPTNPKLQGPYGNKHEWVRYDELSCIECNLLECPKQHQCFIDLPLSRIIGKIDKIIEKNKLCLYYEKN